jgi:DNA-binding protein YbaB
VRGEMIMIRRSRVVLAMEISNGNIYQITKGKGNISTVEFRPQCVTKDRNDILEIFVTIFQ